ncbi:KTSC domain-containing protein [Clostridiisalibacter paucivorans]|uniref:KTSC domain-containing protein n=1 Tax=Clostridiisalibacter paucivorans TaxID=408753 RepID=UPI00047B3389|nr:KTSC domain-containing protein [Clostridiisalibacter paucivorans]
MNDDKILDILYTPENENLIILYESGAKFSYNNVPQLVYQGLLNSTSKEYYRNSLLENFYSSN